MNVNERSSYTEITTGIIKPAWSAVRALNSFSESHDVDTCLT